MNAMKQLALLAALGGGAMLPGVAQAQVQDFSGRMDMTSSPAHGGRVDEGTGLRLTFSIPFGEVNRRQDDQPKLALQFARDGGDGFGVRKLDLMSFSFADGGGRFNSPLSFQAPAGGGNWFADPVNWLWIGGGVLAVWGIYEATKDDDKEEPISTCGVIGPASADSRPARC